MTIRQSRVGPQRTIASLAKAVFDVKADPDLQRRAEEALLQANPGLAAEGGLKPGAPIIVPELGGLQAAAATTPEALPVESVRTVAAATTALTELAGPGLDAALKEAGDRAKMLKAKPTLEAIAAVRPDLKDRLATIAAEAKQESERAAEESARLRETIARIQAALPDFPFR